MYERLLGSAVHAIPAAVRALHRSGATGRFRGRCEIRRSRSWLTTLLARAASLPPAGTTDVVVTIESGAGREVWVREFGRHRMRSVLRVEGNRLHESLGLAKFVFRLDVEGAHVRWILEEIRALGIRLPKRWFDLDVYECERDGRYHFNVRVDVRGVGLLIHYAGHLQ